ncbi:hypothetical protein [Oceanobacillus sp. FSL H7-0719]|uniref:hypothetical protein n=1 Tax=Oceanobacillus sp. FSL H7-0719 TaxID=2954507 RepID=UPI003244C456
MSKFTMKALEDCFNGAIERNMSYVGVSIKMEGLTENEIIINPIANAKDKLEYYRQAYDEDLTHKYAGSDIQIVKVASSNILSNLANYLK